MRDCMNCINHTKDGCKVWNCKFTTVEDAKAEFASDVLEKIKAEIELMDFDFGDYYDNTDTIIEMVSKVIDKHIEKLKGE